MSSVPTVTPQFYIPDQSSATGSSSGSSADDLHWADATSLASSASCGQHRRDGAAALQPVAVVSVATNSDAVNEHADTMPTAIFPMRTYDKWCPTKQGATLVWRDVCVYATRVSSTESSSSTMPRVSSSGAKLSKSGGASATGTGSQQLKRLINNATGAIRPGTLMALMGSRYVVCRGIFKILLSCCSCVYIFMCVLLSFVVVPARVR